MKRLNVIAALVLAGTGAIKADPVSVTAKIDSVETLQGMLRQIDIEVVQPTSLILDWSAVEPPKDNEILEIYPGIELTSASRIDSTRLGNDRLQLTRKLLVQPWDSGEFVIPGLPLIAGIDTFASNPIALKVVPAPTDTMTTINSAMMPTVKQESHFWDWVPDWLYDYWWAYLIAVVAIIAAVVAYLRYAKGGSVKVKVPKVKLIPPYDKAMAQLQELQQKKLCEKGQEKQYYTTLTEILREYLEGRFGIYAMEMTTTQIKRAVYATVPEKEASKKMDEILEMADYVKFAKMRPLPEDNLRALNQAIAFVENTRPAPAAEERKEAAQ